MTLARQSIMPVPERLRLAPASDATVAMMSALCDAIEDAHEGDVDELLTQWHEHAQRCYKHVEFKKYWKSIDKETFVREALNPLPQYLDDATYAEVAAVYEYAISGEGPEHESSYFLDWLDAQFPNANIYGLIFWPDSWFADASLFRDANGAFRPEADLTTDQVLAYAMAKSGRKLADAPTGVTMPFPVP
jgi:hypothetical protein